MIYIIIIISAWHRVSVITKQMLCLKFICSVHATFTDFVFSWLNVAFPTITINHSAAFCKSNFKNLSLKKKKSALQSNVKLNLSYVWRHHFNWKQSVYSLPSLLSQFLTQCTDLLHYVLSTVKFTPFWHPSHSVLPCLQNCIKNSPKEYHHKWF